MTRNKIKKALYGAILNWVFNKSFRGADLRWPSGQDSIDNDREQAAADKAVMDEVWMYSSEYTIANAIAPLPVGVYKQKPSTKGAEWELQQGHWLTKLLQNPNEFQTQFEFMLAVAWTVEHYGQAFIEKVGMGKNKDAKPASLHLCDTKRMRVIPDPKKLVSHYEEVNGAMQPTRFETYEIIWIKQFNPQDVYHGLAASTPAGLAISQNISQAKYANKFYENHCTPYGVVETDRRLPDPEYDRIRRQIAKTNKGPRNWWKLMILEGGLKYKAIQMTPKDLSMKEAKKANKEEILVAYGVNDAVLGTSEKLNNAIAKELQKLFWRQTITPKVLHIAQRLTKDLIKDEVGNTKVMFDLSNIEALQEDQEIKSRIAFNLQKSGVLTQDEIRWIFYKLKPHTGGIGSHVYLPANMVTAEALLENDGKPLSGNKPDGKPGKPGGPDADSSDEGKKPGANDGKPAKMTVQDIAARLHVQEKELEEMFARSEILVG